MTGSDDPSGQTGGGALAIGGGGTVVLAAANTYTGGTTISAGSTLELALPRAAGRGSILFGAGANELRIDGDGTTMPTNTVSGFNPDDSFDLPGIAFDSTGNAAADAGNVLAINEDGQSYALNLDPQQVFSGATFQLRR